MQGHMENEIFNNQAASRFELSVEGALCVLEYHRRERVLVIDHVRVPQAVGGRGIAAALTREALDTARREGWRVIPNCSYAAAWIGRHPEYADLVDAA